MKRSAPDHSLPIAAPDAPIASKEDVKRFLLGDGPWVDTGIRASTAIRDAVIAFQPVLQQRHGLKLKVSQPVTAGWLVRHGFEVAERFRMRVEDQPPRHDVSLFVCMNADFKRRIVVDLVDGPTLESRIPTLIMIALYDLKMSGGAAPIPATA